ncbi:aspartate kinase [Methylosinus sp. Ce-a6]|uniref:amino acid kinase family protein n=1 Tax=Methylosinus sp. Ce-a6 TaxID=2172005 RepID=UPI0013575B29|nr:aspartate kinase [Methylosinus sp. Ce-a6]
MPQSPSAERSLVVKLGGSLCAAPALRDWLSALRRYAGPLTIVPGGGPFADAVRRAQETLRFSDAAAHEMAIMAMEQYGRALIDLEPDLVGASTPREAAAAHERGKAALWRPVAMTRAAPQIPASWDMTSDSLAAWYAHEAGADALLLVKSVDPIGFSPLPHAEEAPKEPSRSTRDRGASLKLPSSFETPASQAPQDEGSFSGDTIAAQPIVDPCFAHYARGLAVFIAGPADLATAGETLRRGGIPGAGFDFEREQSIAS